MLGVERGEQPCIHTHTPCGCSQLGEPDQLGVEFNARILEGIVRHVTPVVDEEAAPLPA